MTYDKNINFYNINPLLAQPQQMTVGDLEVRRRDPKLRIFNFIFFPTPSPLDILPLITKGR